MPYLTIGWHVNLSMNDKEKTNRRGREKRKGRRNDREERNKEKKDKSFYLATGWLSFSLTQTGEDNGRWQGDNRDLRG